MNKNIIEEICGRFYKPSIVIHDDAIDELQKDLKGGLYFYKEYMFAEFLKQQAQLLDDRIRNLQMANEADTNNQLFREGKL